MDPTLLSKAFHRNTHLIQRHAEGLTHEDSLRQSVHNINCFNWVLGHIVATRHDIFRLTDGGPPHDEGRFDRYRTDSDPITEDGDDVIRLGDLLDALAATQETMRAWLDSVDAAWLAEETPVAPDRAAPRADQIHFGYFHDTYHTGQIDLLRQVAGKNDAVL
jgi:uncharacterized damage-inducible protein DinB